MINSVHFRRQVGAVMEILTKAAIAEIAKLVDDGSAVLRLEMYRTQSENETLKAKMEQMESELEAARGRGQAAGLREPPGSTRSVGVQAFQELKEEKQSKMKYAEELCVSVWSERRPAGPNEREPLYNTAPGVEEDRPETHIKQEMLDDDWWNSDPQRWLDVNREGSAERLHDDQNAGEITQTLSEEPKVLCEPQGAEINDQELDGLPFGMKMESWKVCTAQKPNLTEEEYRTGRLNGVTTEYAMDGKISQLWTTFVQDSCTEPGDPPQKSQEDLPLAPAHFNCGNPSLAVNVKLRVGTLDSMATNEDVAASPVCRNEPIPQTRQSREKPTPGRRVDVTIPGRQQHYGGPANKMVASENTEGLETGSPNRYVHMLSGTSFNMTKMLKTCRKACTEEKPFRCSHCGRSFSRLTCLKIHQRSHTGEKPYSCLECGRQFTQQKSLKTHQSVHTGERPFSCTLCGKRFSRQDNCTRHERFHSGKKPFSCKQCGKCFTLQSNLKTHQQIHCGFNRFIFA